MVGTRSRGVKQTMPDGQSDSPSKALVPLSGEIKTKAKKKEVAKKKEAAKRKKKDPREIARKKKEKVNAIMSAALPSKRDHPKEHITQHSKSLPPLFNYGQDGSSVSTTPSRVALPQNLKAAIQADYLDLPSTPQTSAKKKLNFSGLVGASKKTSHEAAGDTEAEKEKVNVMLSVALPSKRDHPEDHITEHSKSLPPLFNYGQDGSSVSTTPSRVAFPKNLKAAIQADYLDLPSAPQTSAKKKLNFSGLVGASNKKTSHEAAGATEADQLLTELLQDGGLDSLLYENNNAATTAATTAAHPVYDVDGRDDIEAQSAEVIGVTNGWKPKKLTSLPSLEQYKNVNRRLFKFQRGPEHYSFTEQDMDRLHCEETALNDNILDFFIYQHERKQKLNRVKNAQHLRIFKTLFYKYLEEPRLLGNTSQAAVHFRRKVDIFRHKNLLVPVFNGNDWHFATCIIANHGYVNEAQTTDSSLFPCILYLDPGKANLLQHKTILEWLNEEYQLQHKSKSAPYTSKSMPLVHLELPKQDGNWECGYIVCAFILRATEALKQKSITVKDQKDNFCGLARLYSFVTPAYINQLKTTIEEQAADFLAVTMVDATKQTERKKQQVTPKHIGQGAATPFRKRKAEDLRNNGASKKERARRVGSPPQSAAQTKDKQVRLQLLALFKCLEGKLWPMSMRPPGSQASENFYFFGSFDYVKGNNERIPFEESGARRAVPKLTLVYPSSHAREPILNAFDSRNDPQLVELVEASTGADFLEAIHPNAQANKVSPKAGDKQVEEKGNEKLQQNLIVDEIESEDENDSTADIFVAEP